MWFSFKSFWNVVKDSSSAVIEDIVTLVKGGITDSSSGLLAIRSPDTYRKWGATLKYNPTLIEYEVTFCKKHFQWFDITCSLTEEKHNKFINLWPHYFCAFAGVVICFSLSFLFLVSLAFLPYDPDNASLWASAPQHSSWPCRCQTGQLAEGLGRVSAAVRLMSLRRLQTQRDPCPHGYLL